MAGGSVVGPRGLRWISTRQTVMRIFSTTRRAQLLALELHPRPPGRADRHRRRAVRHRSLSDDVDLVRALPRRRDARWAWRDRRPAPRARLEPPGSVAVDRPAETDANIRWTRETFAALLRDPALASTTSATTRASTPFGPPTAPTTSASATSSAATTPTTSFTSTTTSRRNRMTDTAAGRSERPPYHASG